ncbi:MAG: MarR family transcriptional regulator [Acholeplasmatales bacterium]|nr:MarR family transcriptional regulator [Acholeplasmatales bacterium]
MGKYDTLKLENQLCFPLYACSKEIIRLYKPFLDKLDLTYTQYITMLILWENEKMTSHDLGECLYLDSGTLTPLLKKLEAKEYITRTRSKNDERNLDIELTDKGRMLKDEALSVPACMGQCIPLEKNEALTLYTTLCELLKKLKAKNNM